MRIKRTTLKMIVGEIKRSDKYISQIAILNITCNYKIFD